jgi:hypothetical protein
LGTYLLVQEQLKRLVVIFDVLELVVVVSLQGPPLLRMLVVWKAGHALEMLVIVRQHAVPVVQQSELVRAAVAQPLRTIEYEVVHLLQACHVASDERGYQPIEELL